MGGTSQCPESGIIALTLTFNYHSNGTLGLYHALQKLGYNPCHMATVFRGGHLELKMMKECFWEGRTEGGKPYDKDDLQKWLGPYDVSSSNTIAIELMLKRDTFS